ncbi:type II toxin-antitoxin system RelE/ParE family toxin [Candidatus Gottesmanbacteria bacterium]|nr:type II toxin-antitoxin system RelE/ParE family toxin [Candidatus Gottesmanbacteria bacterium]
MKITLSPTADKQLKKLPQVIDKKFIKQLTFLVSNPEHPSLRSKKMASENKFEARIDRHYRFTYLMTKDEVFIISVGPHDEGLGKK